MSVFRGRIRREVGTAGGRPGLPAFRARSAGPRKTLHRNSLYITISYATDRDRPTTKWVNQRCDRWRLIRWRPVDTHLPRLDHFRMCTLLVLVGRLHVDLRQQASALCLSR